MRVFGVLTTKEIDVDFLFFQHGNVRPKAVGIQEPRQGIVRHRE